MTQQEYVGETVEVAQPLKVLREHFHRAFHAARFYPPRR
jgi:hypothetical protein